MTEIELQHWQTVLRTASAVEGDTAHLPVNVQLLRTLGELIDAYVAREVHKVHGPEVGSWINADDVDRNVRALDLALNGRGRAAERPSLADVVSQVQAVATRLGRPVLETARAAKRPNVPDVTVATPGTDTPGGRLATLLWSALGMRHPALDDLAILLLQAKAASEAQAEPVALKEGLKKLRAFAEGVRIGHAPDQRLLASRLEAIADAISAAPQQPAPADHPRLTVRVASFPESNGKRNWTALLVRAEPWGGLIGNCGGITIARGELWNRVVYEAECARALLGERDTEPHILDYGDDIHTPDEWVGEVRGGKAVRPPKPAPAERGEQTALPEPMTPDRARYFMERFLHEEKMLGPNEQAALRYVIGILERGEPPAQGVVDESDLVAVPRGLLGAACAAIRLKHDAPKTVEQLRRYTFDDLSAALASAPRVPPELDVRRILLRVVPGDGNGQEVYAQSVDDVEKLLSEMGLRIEELEASSRPYCGLPPGWRLQRNGDGSIGLFAPPAQPGEPQRTSHAFYRGADRDGHELLSKLVDHVGRAA